MFSWISVFLLSAIVMAISWALVFLYDSGARGRATKYRDQYERLIQDLERLVRRANELNAEASKCRDTVLLDHYHSAIKMIETLLLAVKKIRTYGDDVDVLAAPIFLAKDINERLERVRVAMARGQRGKPHEFMKTAPVMSQTALGCHFCSRPFDAHIFSKVRVKIDGRSEEVASCHYCREKLLSTRKARVLFFTENGQQIHWTKAKSWTPSPEYWNINRDDLAGASKAPHLELIYSNVSRLNSPNHMKE